MTESRLRGLAVKAVKERASKEKPEIKQVHSLSVRVFGAGLSCLVTLTVHSLSVFVHCSLALALALASCLVTLQCSLACPLFIGIGILPYNTREYYGGLM